MAEETINIILEYNGETVDSVMLSRNTPYVLPPMGQCRIEPTITHFLKLRSAPREKTVYPALRVGALRRTLS